MTLAEIARYNAKWLKAWTDKDVARLLRFYADDCVYKDAQTAAGLTGHAALGAYLTGLFAATPAMTYTADEVWPIPGGFCGRWYCDMDRRRPPARLRPGDSGRRPDQQLNEVYVHQLGA